MSASTVSPAHRSKSSLWLQAVRPFSFSASFIPVALGASLAYAHGPALSWPLLPVVILGGLLIHAGINLTSEYFDFKKAVDRADTYGSSRVLVDRLLMPHQVLAAGWILILGAALMGSILIASRGWPMLILCSVGGLGGYFYTGRPVGYKYFAMGDIMVFVLMGPLMVIGSYMALAGTYDVSVLLVSLPIGCLAAAILHVNNMRDIQHDAQVNVKTLANLLGHRSAKVEYIALVSGAYAIVGALIVFHILTPWALLVLLSSPSALKIIRAVWSNRPDRPDQIAAVDVQTAQHHMQFGLLLIMGVLAS